ncbi:MAG: hypothetical protein OEW18_06565 [Candidatus Aminicenantes bacterium]|nr:hypothetical protein [Candidatus Aminicenantes bacterium]
MYEDRLNGVIKLDQCNEHKQRIANEPAKIVIDLERLDRHNFDCKDQGSTALELLKGFKRFYSQQNLEGKAKILRVVLDRIIFKGNDTVVVWTRPFDLPFAIGKLAKEKGVRKDAKWGE